MYDPIFWFNERFHNLPMPPEGQKKQMSIFLCQQKGKTKQRAKWNSPITCNKCHLKGSAKCHLKGINKNKANKCSQTQIPLSSSHLSKETRLSLMSSQDYPPLTRKLLGAGARPSPSTPVTWSIKHRPFNCHSTGSGVPVPKDKLCAQTMVHPVSTIWRRTIGISGSRRD